MTERLRRMTDDELGSALAGLAADLAFPEPSADLAALAVARIRQPAPARAPFGRRVRRWLVGLLPPRGMRRALVIAVLIVSMAAVAAGAAYVGVRGIQIVFQNGTTPSPGISASGPSLSPSPLPSPTLPSLGDRLELGIPSTLEAARAEVDFSPAVPPAVQGFGQPLVFLSYRPVGGRVSFVWVRPGSPGAEPRPALLLTEFHANPYRPFIRKLVDAGTRVTRVQVNGETGYWLSGTAHELDYVDRNGSHFNDESRLAGNTLIWTRGPVTLRLEGSPTLREAMAVALATR